MIIRQPRLGFTAGELSPLASSRVDLDMFSRGAGRIQNFMITPFGGLIRRPGFVFVAEASDTHSEVRLIPFQYSTGDAFILELTSYTIRFFTKGALVTKADGVPYEVYSPWLYPYKLHFYQINDIMYICCDSDQVYCLERHGDLDWRLRKPKWLKGPWRTNAIQSRSLRFEKTDMQTEGRPIYKVTIPDIVEPGPYGGFDFLRITMTEPDENQWINGDNMMTYWFNYGKKANLASASYNVGDAVYLDDGSGFNSWFECIRAYTPGGNYNGSNDPRNYPYFFETGVHAGHAPMNISDLWEFRTSGTWSGQWLLQRSYDNGASWTTIKSFFSSNDSNFVTNGSEKDAPCLMRVRIAQAGISQHLRTVNFKSVSHRVDHVLELTYADEMGSWLGTKRDDFPMQSKGITYDWSMSSFGSLYGYPRAMAWHQNRLVFASTPAQPQTIWISATDDYENFKLGSDDANAMELTLSASAQNGIQWLRSQQRLFLGTTEGEWTLDTSDGRTLTPANACFICHSHQGSESLDPIPMGSSLVFLQKGKRKIREMSYHLDSDGYLSTDLTLFAGHITSPGIKSMCLYEDSTQMLWAIKSDWEAVGMTWIPGQNILAWNRITVSEGSRILSVASIRGDSGSQELWAVIQRYDSDYAPRTIERLGLEPILPADGQTPVSGYMPVYLDSNKVCSCKQRKIYGADHLKGLRVSAYLVNDPFTFYENLEVNDMGEIDLPPSYGPSIKKWVVGIPYVSLLMTNPFDQIETTGQLKNHISTEVKVLHSWPEFEYSSSLSGPWYEAGKDVATRSGSAYFSGYISLNQEVSHQENPQLCLRTSSFHPFNILTVVPKLSFQEDQ